MQRPRCADCCALLLLLLAGWSPKEAPPPPTTNVDTGSTNGTQRTGVRAAVLCVLCVRGVCGEQRCCCCAGVVLAMPTGRCGNHAHRLACGNGRPRAHESVHGAAYVGGSSEHTHTGRTERPCGGGDSCGHRPARAWGGLAEPRLNPGHAQAFARATSEAMSLASGSLQPGKLWMQRWAPAAPHQLHQTCWVTRGAAAQRAGSDQKNVRACGGQVICRRLDFGRHNLQAHCHRQQVPERCTTTATHTPLPVVVGLKRWRGHSATTGAH